MEELNINTAKRGMRVVTGHECRLALISPELGGYFGTIVEVTESIPTNWFGHRQTCAGDPGALVYWDHLDDTMNYNQKDIYHQILPARLSNNISPENLQWVAFQKIN